jgi:hypothetical protein
MRVANAAAQDDAGAGDAGLIALTIDRIFDPEVQIWIPIPVYATGRERTMRSSAGPCSA